LVRFLRARKWDIQKSEQMYRNRMKWIEEKTPHLIKEEDMIDLIRNGKSFWHGFDKDGRPILIVRAGKHFPSGDEAGQEKDLKFLFYMIEIGLSLMPPPPYNQFVILYDRANFTKKNFDLSMIRNYACIGDCKYNMEISNI
jgi:hypothetical protein